MNNVGKLELGEGASSQRRLDWWAMQRGRGGRKRKERGDGEERGKRKRMRMKRWRRRRRTRGTSTTCKEWSEEDDASVRCVDALERIGALGDAHFAIE